jgi:F420H(2)-dependent quinone reductase
MDEQTKQALEQGGVIDITTRGRKTGQAHRIEIRFHNIEGLLYITGTPPRRRNWYANLRAQPEFTFHLRLS